MQVTQAIQELMMQFQVYTKTFPHIVVIFHTEPNQIMFYFETSLKTLEYFYTDET